MALRLGLRRLKQDRMSDPEWSVEFRERGALLGLLEPLFRAERALDDDIQFALVLEVSGLRVEIFSREHPPPHFRVRYAGETANYRISDCVQLNGGLQRHYGFIQKWHARHKDDLIETWNRLRPSNCPVGAYRE